MPTSYEPSETHDTADNMTWMTPILVDNGIRRIEANLSGGGDEGSIDEVRFYDQNGDEIDPEKIRRSFGLIGSPFANQNAMDDLENAIERDALNEGDWVNNDGGTVESAYIITSEGVFIEYVNLTYNEPDHDEEYDDDEEDDEYDM